MDDYGDDLLGIQIQTSKGPVALFTIYNPPRRNYLPLGDIRRALQRNIPVYIIAGLNPHHQILCYTRVNNKGRMTKDLIDRNIARYLGPDFPTLIGKNTKPDAVITNRISYLNISIQPGDITTSDHLPIVITILTRPIAKENQPKFYFKKSNWQKFQEKISNNTILTNMNNLTKDDIDKEAKNWMNTIISSANEVIPKSKIHYLTHPVDSDYSKILMNMYTQLYRRDSWNTQQLYLIRRLQEEIRNENLRLYNEKRSEAIRKLQSIYKDPKLFWSDIRRMMGGSKNTNAYIVNSGGERLYTGREKDTLQETDDKK